MRFLDNGQIRLGVDLGKGGTILLVHRDGQLLAREPELEDTLGTSFVK